MHFTLLSVLAALTPPSAWAAGADGAAVGLMAETMRKTLKRKEAVITSRHGKLMELLKNATNRFPNND